ncbi:hypothetical protein E2C01_081738 [Portunus trituberculatus]|uniref:Uncharacterized protein n=1 Tax=Portunus trituberculatus TaxID=210409 RepID=A0A5B7IXB4_PORTR|nr:hypothetical protein [Portunus trituberculatus]
MESGCEREEKENQVLLQVAASVLGRQWRARLAEQGATSPMVVSPACRKGFLAKSSQSFLIFVFFGFVRVKDWRGGDLTWPTHPRLM